MKTVAVIYEANRNVGFGHKARMRLLCDFLEKDSRFGNIIFRCREEMGQLYPESIDVCVIDFSDYSILTSNELKFIDLVPFVVGIEVYGNVDSFDLNYFIFDRFANDETNLNNLRNALVVPLDRNDNHQSVLHGSFGVISLGGTATISAYEEVVIKLKESTLSHSDLVILSPVELGLDSILDVPVYVNHRDFANVCHNSHFCVVAPGMTMLEMLAINKKVYAYPLTENHIKFSEFLERNNIAYTLSSFPKNDSDFVHDVVSGLGCLNLINLLV